MLFGYSLSQKQGLKATRQRYPADTLQAQSVRHGAPWRSLVAIAICFGVAAERAAASNQPASSAWFFLQVTSKEKLSGG